MSGDNCHADHDFFTALLTFGLCVGLIVSYLPQHFRIIHKSTSEGISPWFLLLGSTSAAAGMLNLFIVQWSVIKCCRYVVRSLFGFVSLVLALLSTTLISKPSMTCLEMTAGEYQVGLQWLLFTLILILYMVYFPQHLKYATVTTTHDGRHATGWKKSPPSTLWRFSIWVSWLTAAHFLILVIVSVILLSSNSMPADAHPTPSSLPPPLHSWATFLGVSSAILAAIQYMPQLIHTYRLQLVGALSIPMMCIQSPGAILMVLSIALRPGTNWTSWITFAVAGIMQGSLLIMCILWKIRQYRLGIDDFGHPLEQGGGGGGCGSATTTGTNASEYEEVPGLVTSQEEEDPKAITRALAHAIGDAVSTDVRDEAAMAEAAARREQQERLRRVPEIMIDGQPLEEAQDSETTPLLPGGSSSAKGSQRDRGGWFRGWF